MLLLSGKVANVFRTVRGQTKEGRDFGGDHKVQLLAQVPAEDGTFRIELVDLKVKDAAVFEGKRDREVQIPVGVFSPAKGSVIFFMTGAPQFGKAAP